MRCKAVPYGTYDVAEDEALVNVEITHDTAEFAAASIQRWWRMLGRKSYPRAKRLLICADAGGSNGNRSRGWKFHLQEFADTIGIPITVCHYSLGTSNLRGQLLVSYEAVVDLIRGTRIRSGLKVKAMLDTSTYEKGQKVSNQQIQKLNLHGHSFHPDRNYTLSPRTS